MNSIASVKEGNDWPEEPKILLSDVSKIFLWSRRKQWKDKILEENAAQSSASLQFWK